jgi:hypothetical protein
VPDVLLARESADPDHLESRLTFAALGAGQQEPRSLVARLHAVGALCEVADRCRSGATKLVLEICVTARETVCEPLDLSEQLKGDVIGVETLVDESSGERRRVGHAIPP